MHTVAALRDAESGGSLGPPCPGAGPSAPGTSAAGFCVPVKSSVPWLLMHSCSQSPGQAAAVPPAAGGCEAPPQQNALSEGSWAPRCLLLAPQSLLTLLTSGPPPPPFPYPPPFRAQENASGIGHCGRGCCFCNQGKRRQQQPAREQKDGFSNRFSRICCWTMCTCTKARDSRTLPPAPGTADS